MLLGNERPVGHGAQLGDSMRRLEGLAEAKSSPQLGLDLRAN